MLAQTLCFKRFDDLRFLEEFPFQLGIARNLKQQFLL